MAVGIIILNDEFSSRIRMAKINTGSEIGYQVSKTGSAE